MRARLFDATEIPWAPDAILHNTELRWRQEGPDTLLVSAGSGGTASEVTLVVHSDRRVACAFAADRRRSASEPFLPTPWRGRFSDYRRNDGLWLPYAGAVGWVIDGNECGYWEACLQQWEATADER